MNWSATLFMKGSLVTGRRLFCGLICWNSDPELYRRTSSMAPVDRRVFTRLSSSVPPGPMSSLMVILGLAAWKSLASCCAVLMACSVLPTMKLSVTAPFLPELEPRLPELQAVTAREHTARAASAHRKRRRRVAENLIVPPERRRDMNRFNWSRLTVNGTLLAVKTLLRAGPRAGPPPAIRGGRG